MTLHTDFTERHHSNRRLRSTTDRRLKNRIEELDIQDRRERKERRGLIEDLRRMLFDRRVEEIPVEVEQREIPRRDRTENRRQTRDRRLIEIEVKNERRKSARRQAEIERLIELEPSVSTYLAPQEVENDLNRRNK